MRTYISQEVTDGLSSSVAAAGDVNGDKISDMLVGADDAANFKGQVLFILH